MAPPIPAEVLDAIKSQGYKYSTRAALTVAVCDATIPPNKKEVLAAAEEKVAKITQEVRPRLYFRGRPLPADHCYLAMTPPTR